MKPVCLAVILFVASLVVLLTGCAGGESEADASAQAQSSVDPRFATAEALLAEYNRISTAPVVDPNAQVDLIYAENDLQHRCVAMLRSMIPLTELDRCMFDNFKEGWDPKSKKRMTSPENPATMLSIDGQRARAEYLDDKNARKSLQLVKIGDRWWVSGYTLEHEPDFQRYRDNFSGMERLNAAMNKFIPSVIADIDRGDIKSAQQARIQLMSSCMAYDQSLGDVLKKLANAK